MEKVLIQREKAEVGAAASFLRNALQITRNLGIRPQEQKRGTRLIGRPPTDHLTSELLNVVIRLHAAGAEDQ